ncbi:unnamed protein product [Rotaria sp. Silwood1]|nr:unnamed protein product [Rotaria sp. Silwood1]CAF4980927.1 unnamed protein product [Rotaria sp. Silwood1]CAF5010418.1 unnamed protein product [Rotaria sp. Silwood1]
MLIKTCLHICMCVLTICILGILIFYKVLNVRNSWQNIKIKPIFTVNFSSTYTSSPSLISTQQSTDNIRKFAVFASSIHSELRSYIFYTPITAAAWQRIGYDVIVIFVGDFTTNNNDRSLSKQLNITRTLLKRLDVHVIDFQCNSSYSIKISQLVRIFTGFLSDSIIKDTDYIITTDSDIIPMRKDDYILKNNRDGFIYNAFCCGTFTRRGKVYKMYPMSHIYLSKQLWRNLFLESIQRKELLNSNLSSLNTILLSDNAPFSFDTISLYTRHEFGQIYDSNMKKGDSAWYMDQVYSSMLLDDYCEKHPNIIIDKFHKTSMRLDPDLSQQFWQPQSFKRFGDAHIIHDEIFDSHRWASFKNLLFYMFNSSLANDFDLYYKEFILTLRNKPEDH